MFRSKRYTKDQFIDAVRTSGSYRQVLTKLGLNETGGNYSNIREKIKLLDLDISHFYHNAWSKGKKLGPKRTLDYYLNNLGKITSHSLRLRLLKEGIKSHKCENCNLTEWLGNPIPLELDHIDGNKYNNEIQNLRLLCPNCHYETPTHRGKNWGKYAASEI